MFTFHVAQINFSDLFVGCMYIYNIIHNTWEVTCPTMRNVQQCDNINVRGFEHGYRWVWLRLMLEGVKVCTKLRLGGVTKTGV